MSPEPTSETFGITTEPVDAAPGHSLGRLAAQGALTELGGELAFAAVSSLLSVGVREMTLDLSQLTAVEDAGLCWLRRAWLRVDAAGGCLWTVGVADQYRAVIPTSRPYVVKAEPTQQRLGSTAATHLADPNIVDGSVLEGPATCGPEAREPPE